MSCVLYLHGLESRPTGPKTEFLAEVFESVFAPELRYFDDPSIFNSLLQQYREAPISLIVGSSMGGWLGYHLSTHLGCDTLLFNPAVHSRSIEIATSSGNRAARHRVMLGQHDDVIEPQASIAWLRENGLGTFNFQFYNGGHRVPLDVFKKAILH